MSHSPAPQGSESAGSDPTLPCVYDVLNTLGDDGRPSAVTSEMHTLTPETAASAVAAFHERRFVAVAPKFHETLASSEQRQGKVTYQPDIGYTMMGVVAETTEGEALNNLLGFLELYQETFGGTNHPGDSLTAERAKELQEHLFFVGKPEFEEGAAGIAALWRSYLEEPGRLLWVPDTIPSHRNVYLKGRHMVFDAVMQHFPEDDPLRARILTDKQAAADERDRVKVILLDDWTKNDIPLADLYANYELQRYRDVEVNLLAAADEQLEHGTRILERNYMTPLAHLPTRAYYNAGPDAGTMFPDGPFVTGVHNTAPRDVGERLLFMWNALCERRPDLAVPLPMFANIIAPRNPNLE